MKKVCLSLAVLGLLLAVPGLSQAGEVERCKIEGTWYGFNTFGEVFVQTMHQRLPRLPWRVEVCP